MLSVDIPRLMQMLPRTVAPTRADEQVNGEEKLIGDYEREITHM